jgi:hypothetical protein
MEVKTMEADAAGQRRAGGSAYDVATLLLSCHVANQQQRRNVS